MPVTPTYPGVYIEEIASGVRTITGVATSITAFLGRASRGPVSEPTTIFNFGDFERMFGGLGVDYPMSYTVRDFYLNGGSQAIIVRLINTPPPAAAPPAPGPGPAPPPPPAPPPAAKQAEIAMPALAGIAGATALPLLASSPGSWGNNLEAVVDYNTKEGKIPDAKRTLFNLTVSELDDTGNIVQQEKHLNVSPADSDPRYLPRVLKDSSNLVRVKKTARDPPTGYRLPCHRPLPWMPRPSSRFQCRRMARAPTDRA